MKKLLETINYQLTKENWKKKQKKLETKNEWMNERIKKSCNSNGNWIKIVQNSCSESNNSKEQEKTNVKVTWNYEWTKENWIKWKK